MINSYKDSGVDKEEGYKAVEKILIRLIIVIF